MKKIISFLLSICFVLSACVFSVSSTTLQESTLEVEEKIYCNATIVAGDFNNDGKCDMSALYTPTNNTVDLQYHVWLSNGSSFPTRSYWY